MPLIALLDANVIWSAAVRDTLLRAAERNLYRPAWTLRILEEMAHGLPRKRPHLDPARIRRTVDLMLAHFPEALITGYEDLIPVMRNHEGDRHVLAAAVRVGAAVLVTHNVAHFPVHACTPYDISVQTPDEFLLYLFSLNPEAMLLVLKEQAGPLVRPPKTTSDLIETLRRSVPRFADAAERELTEQALQALDEDG